jgi:hypothetical protein
VFFTVARAPQTEVPLNYNIRKSPHGAKSFREVLATTDQTSALRDSDPRRVAEGSRRLSEAIPPVSSPIRCSTPAGVADTEDVARALHPQPGTAAPSAGEDASVPHGGAHEPPGLRSARSFPGPSPRPSPSPRPAVVFMRRRSSPHGRERPFDPRGGRRRQGKSESQKPGTSSGSGSGETGRIKLSARSSSRSRATGEVRAATLRL